MELTTTLAQVWGPVMLAIGLGIFVSRAQYLRVYRDLEKESLAVLVFGIAGIALGIAQITAHNTWSTLPEIIVSLLGWGLLLKGAVFAIAPRFVDKSGDWSANSRMLPVVGVALLVIGAYLSWVGFVV